MRSNPRKKCLQKTYFSGGLIYNEIPSFCSSSSLNEGNERKRSERGGVPVRDALLQGSFKRRMPWMQKQELREKEVLAHGFSSTGALRFCAC